jgi:hypothetical protein
MSISMKTPLDTPTIPVVVDAKFVSTIGYGGNDFMLQAALDRPEAFQACIDGGWAKINRGKWFQKSFLSSLPKIVDEEVAAHVLRQVLKDATPEEVNWTIIEKYGNDNTPARQWFSHHGVTAKWRKRVFKEALDLGLDLLTEFPHSTNNLGSARYTLTSSFVADAHRMLTASNVDEAFKQYAAPVIELLDLGAPLDKNTLLSVVKHHDAAVVPAWLMLFEERNLLQATDALKSISRSKIPPGNLAYLQSKAARDAIDLAIHSNGKKGPK